MTQHYIAARVQSFMICLITGITLLFVVARSPVTDHANNCAARGYVKQQAKAAAQPDTWAKLDRQGRDMVAFDRIGK